MHMQAQTTPKAKTHIRCLCIQFGTEKRFLQKVGIYCKKFIFSSIYIALIYLFQFVVFYRVSAITLIINQFKILHLVNKGLVFWKSKI